MRTTTKSLAVCVSLLLCLASDLSAVDTKVLRDDTFSDFNQGESTGTELLAEGKLRIGARPKRLARTEDAIAWKIALDRYDRNLFFSTGHEGKVWRLDPTGQLELWADLEEIEATAITVDFTGAVLVGTSPGGKIYRIVRAGKPELFFDTKEQYVWDLIFDRDGVLYAATGTSGRIFRIRGPNNGEIYHETGATNVMGLAFDSDGRLLAATQGKGLVLRIPKARTASVLYAATEDECRSLTVDPLGNIYVAVNSARLPGVLDPLREERSASAKQGATASPSSPPSAPRPPEVVRQVLAAMAATLANLGGQSSVVRIERSGFASTFWTAQEAPIHALVADPTGHGILVAAGSRGKIYRLLGDTNFSLVADVEEQSAFSFTSHNGTIYFATANRAAVYALGDRETTRALFGSRPINAGSIVAWGNVLLEGDIPNGTSIDLFVRTGNTPDPTDRTWSQWNKAQELAGGFWSIDQPVAQYLQYRLEMTSTREQASPLVDALQFFYVQRNAAPVLKSIKVEKVGGEAAAPPTPQQPTSVPAPSPASSGSPAAAAREAFLAAIGAPRQEPQPQSTPIIASALGAPSNSTKFNISWEATDPNGDKLVYRIAFKAEDEKLWKTLEKEFSSTRYTLDSSLLADGRYQILVEASDRPQNPDDRAATATIVSRTFVVDNSPPEVTDFAAEKVGSHRWEIKAVARDALSIVASASYCIDTEETWYALLPEDGIFDNQRESFRFRVTPTERLGEHVLRLRVADREGNARVVKLALP